MVLSGHAETVSRAAQKAQEQGVRKKFLPALCNGLTAALLFESREKSEPVKELAKILK